MIKPITPQQVDGFDDSEAVDKQKKRFIEYINGVATENKRMKSFKIDTWGVLQGPADAVKLFHEVLDEFEKSGWSITNRFIFFSFNWKVSFNMEKP